ncbi:hypothetical protein LJC14_01915 [Treponema sp. OttesenSCG-928-L16]|nr:hypothetical protein [Treponema sp. OttesenSCG-928-L16]
MKRNIGSMVLQISLALYLFANGILLFSDRGNELTGVIRSIFGRGDFPTFLGYVFGACAIVAGVFLLLEFFSIEIAVTDLILLIFTIIWIVFIVLVDIINPISRSFKGMSFASYLISLSSHLMVLGAIVSTNKRFN